MKKYFLLILIIAFFGIITVQNLFAFSFEIYSVGEYSYPTLLSADATLDEASGTVTITAEIKDISGVCSAKASINSVVSDLPMQNIDPNNSDETVANTWVTIYTKTSGWTQGTYLVDISATDCLSNNSMAQGNQYINITSFNVTSGDKAITAFNFNGLSPAVMGVINETNHTIALTVPFGTSVAALVPTIAITGVSVNPPSGTAHDFTIIPQTYRVTAADNSTQDYAVTVTVDAPPPLIVSAAASPNPATTGQTITFSAAVSGGTGTYSYVWAGDCSGVSQTCQTSFMSAGDYTAVVAETSGGQTVPASATVTVNSSQINTTTVFNMNPTTIVQGGTVSLSAMLTNSSTGIGISGKTINFIDGTGQNATIVATGTTNSNGSVSVNYIAATVGARAMRAEFPGDGSYYASLSANRTLTVTVPVRFNTTTTFNMSPTTIVQGGTVSLSALLTNSSTGIGISGKTINFIDGTGQNATIVATGTTSSNGSVSVNYIAATVGARAMRAEFPGDGSYYASLSANQTLTVTAPVRFNTTTTFNMSPTTIVQGGTVSLSAMLTTSLGIGISGKTINFIDGTGQNSTIVATGTTNSNGSVSVNYIAATVGARIMRAEF